MDGGEDGVTEVVEADVEGGGGVEGGAAIDRRRIPLGLGLGSMESTAIDRRKPRNASWNASGSMSCRRRKSARSNCRSRR